MGRFRLKGRLVERKLGGVFEAAAAVLLLTAFMNLANRDLFAGAPDEQDLKRLQLVVFEPPIKAPDFVLEDLSGKKVRLKEHRGKPVLLYFWGTW